jgi:hypothetical protein
MQDHILTIWTTILGVYADWLIENMNPNGTSLEVSVSL